jgi:HSP20 family protein
MAESKKSEKGEKHKKDKSQSSVPIRRVEAQPVESEARSWISSGPFGLMRRMEEDMSRLWSEFFGRGPVWPWRESALGPRVDVCVTAELPGVKPEDVEINATEDMLVVSGESRREEKVEEEGYYRSERSFGRFQRQIELPAPVKADQAKASFKDGVLEISLPKVEEAKPRTVKVPIQK